MVLLARKRPAEYQPLAGDKICNPFRKLDDLVQEEHKNEEHGLYMTFYKEPQGYCKTALSDLQGSWQLLRNTVLEKHPFPDSDRLLFHIEEGMSWESVRNLNSMHNTLLLIRNIAINANAPEDVLEYIEMVSEDLDGVLAAISEGEKI